MTTKEVIEVKSRRAHSTCLDNPKTDDIFDADLFCENFLELNPALVVWDSIKGVRE